MRIRTDCLSWVLLISITLAPASATTTLSSNTTGGLWVGEDAVALDCTTEIINASHMWYLDGERLPGDDRYTTTVDLSQTNATLTISPVFGNDTGNFSCEVTNGTTTELSNNLTLNLIWAPANTSIACEIQPFPEYALFTCSWSGGTPPASINLTFNGTVETGQNIVMKNVTVGNEVQQPELVCQGDQVGRKSECKTTLERPQSTSHSGTPTTSADTGGNATMTVTVSSNTFQPQFSWFFLNPGSVPINTTDKRFTVDFSNTQSTLHITNVTSSDDGTYECRARNVIGSTNFTFRVQVTTPGSSSGGLSGGAIAGIVIGVIAGVALIGVGVFFLVKKL